MYARPDRSGTFCWEDSENGRQGSLKTKDRGQAAKLLQAKNETVRQPNLNRELGRVHMKAADLALTTRTWQQVIDAYCSRPHLREASRDRPRRAFAGRQFDPIRHVVLTETSTDRLLGVVEKARNASTQHYLRRLHNYAVGIGWLPWQVVPPRIWPPQHSQRRRAITEAEHAQIIATESNREHRLYYELLWRTGASQSDGAELTAARVDWENDILSFSRKKPKPDDPPCIMRIGSQLAGLLGQLPTAGFLFPAMSRMT